MIEFIFPLDFYSTETAYKWGEDIGDEVDVFKIGFQLFSVGGPEVVKHFTEGGKEVFLDLKFCDIPNTVERASRMVADLGVKYLTIHSTGGEEMIAGAKKGIKGYNTKILAVTLLTSIGQSQYDKIFGKLKNMDDYILFLAKLSYDSGADGVICSVGEAELIRENLPDDFLIVTPGIRLNYASDDQKRVFTPEDAKKAGVNGIVMGRPVIESDNPLDFIRQVKTMLRGSDDIITR